MGDNSVRLFEELFGEAEAKHSRKVSTPLIRTGRIELEIAFAAPDEAARSYFMEGGVDGIALYTDQPLVQGQLVGVHLRAPEWEGPMELDGEVSWTTPSGVGLVFRTISTEHRARLRPVARKPTLMGRVRRLLGAQDALARPLVRVVGAKDVVFFATQKSLATQIAARTLIHDGYRVVSSLEPGVNPALVVTDVLSARESKKSLSEVPVVLLNVEGPSALPSDLLALGPAAYVKAPLSPEALVSAVKRVAPLR